MQGIHPSESEPLLIARLASLDLDVVPESFTARIIRDGIDATAPAIRRAMSAARSRHFLILHEYATSLDFAPHVLLTPHVTRGMPFIPIAYLPYNVGRPVPFERRTIAASFRGAMTSDLRARLAPHPPFGHLLPASGEKGNLLRCCPSSVEKANLLCCCASQVRKGSLLCCCASQVRKGSLLCCCASQVRKGSLLCCCPSPRGSGERVAEGRVRGVVIEDSGAFHDHHDAATQAANRDHYVELLANSRIAICPRGAGAATFRFWEALAMGCVPLLISDNLMLPLEDRIDWDAIVLRLAEDDVDRLRDFVEAQDEAHLATMAEEGHRVWEAWFSPENWIRGVAAAVSPQFSHPLVARTQSVARMRGARSEADEGVVEPTSRRPNERNEADGPQSASAAERV
jgi:hypothetical protein